MTAVPAPVEPPGPIGEVIRGLFGKGAPEQLIPVEGTPTHFNKYAAGPTWNDVWDWVSNGFADDVKGPVTLNMPNVLTAILAGLSRLQSAMSGFVNLSIDYTATVAQQAAHATKFAFIQQHQMAQLLWHEMHALALLQGTALNNATHDTHQQVDRLDAKIDNSNRAQTNSIQRWATDNIYDPLRENIGDVYRGLSHVIDAKSLLAIGAANAFTLAHVGQITRTLGDQAARLRTLEKWVDDCGEPVCQVAGPKTDLGKWLKGLELAKWLAALAVLATMTEDDLERLAARVAALASGSIPAFLESFIDQGHTLGGALADTVQDAL